jgi:hypothetical protein
MQQFCVIIASIIAPQQHQSDQNKWQRSRRETYEGREGLFYTFMGMSKQKRVKLISLLLPQSNQQHDILYIIYVYVRAHNIISLSKLRAT